MKPETPTRWADALVHNTIWKDIPHRMSGHDSTDTRNLLHDLIIQAEFLGPEGEGLDLDDLDLDRDQIADLRMRASTMRSAIDEVNRALAWSFAETLPNPRAAVALDDRLIARLSWTNPRPRWLDDSANAFATWLKDQPIETIAKVVSKWSRRAKVPIPGFAKRSVPPAIWDTFTVTAHDDKPYPSLEIAPAKSIDTKWLQRLAPGDVAHYVPGGIVWHEKGKTETLRCTSCGRFYNVRSAIDHEKCEAS